MNAREFPEHLVDYQVLNQGSRARVNSIMIIQLSLPMCIDPGYAHTAAVLLFEQPARLCRRNQIASTPHSVGVGLEFGIPTLYIYPAVFST